MRTVAAIAAAFALCGSASAGPKPDPPPGGTWDGTYTGYTYDTVSVDGLWRYRCYVPAVGKRHCEKIGATRAGVRFLLK